MLQAMRWIAMLLLIPVCAAAQSPRFDTLIKGGRVIDPRNRIDSPMDVGIKGGKIVEVAANLPESSSSKVIAAQGLLVVPGLIDLHVHVFSGTEEYADYSNGYSAVAPDGFTFRSGVTTVVDTGGAGWRNFHQFKRQTIDRAKTRVLALLNIVGSGMKGGPVEQNLGDMDPHLAAVRAREFPGLIVGIKLAHFIGRDWEPVDRAVAAGKEAGLPVMVDFGRCNPPLSLAELLLEHLRPGDIFTHVYADVENRMPVVGSDGKVGSFAREARQRGVIFDVGHGGGSFVFRQAVPAMSQDFAPDTISTDLHIGSMNAGMKDLINVMSKFLNMRMGIGDVIAKVTWNAARVIRREDLGHLSPGATADVSILRLDQGTFGFIDSEGWRMNGDRKLACELVMREGSVVWDLNGRAARDWETRK